MKKYEKVSHIVMDDTDEFIKKVATRIDEYQTLGLQIEVQYQEMEYKSCAFILGYSEVDKL